MGVSNTGAAASVLERGAMIVIDASYCKGCGICVYVCAKHVLEISSEVNSLGYYMPNAVNGDECTNCRQCELYCPDFAVFIVEDQKDENG